MGNSLGLGKKSAKVMKISGETFKLKTPVRAGSVLLSHPGHVLLDSEAVRYYGIRAKPLEPQQELKPKRLYFLVELPKEINKGPSWPRRVRSGIQMSAKDRLESLMLARRSASDLSNMRPPMIHEERGGLTTVKIRVPKADIDRLMAESNKDGADVAEKIVSLCMATGGGASAERSSNNVYWENEHGVAKSSTKSREKRVGFLPISEGEIQLAVAS